MDDAQRKYILSVLANEVMKEPTKYGLQADGIVRIGETIDLGPLFKDVEKLKGIFAKAEKLTPEQKDSILENNRKISAWVKEHPTDVLSTDKVNEILSAIPKLTPLKPEAYEIAEPQKPAPITEAKPIPRSMATDSAFAEEMERAFTTEINSVYSEGGVMGFGKAEGINSKAWAFISKLSAAKVLEYFTNDSNKSTLPTETIKELGKSEKHHELVRQIMGLMQETNGVVKPYENETIVEFLKRLGGFVMKNHLSK